MSQYKVIIESRATYLVDTQASNYDYILMDEDGNILPDNEQSVEYIETMQTLPNLRYNGGGTFVPHIETIYVTSVRRYDKQDNDNANESVASNK